MDWLHAAIQGDTSVIWKTRITVADVHTILDPHRHRAPLLCRDLASNPSGVGKRIRQDDGVPIDRSAIGRQPMCIQGERLGGCIQNEGAREGGESSSVNEIA